MSYLSGKGIKPSFKLYFVQALSNMAYGLFASLLIGTIFSTIGTTFNIAFMTEIADFAKSATGAAMGVAVSYALNPPFLVLLSSVCVGVASNALGGPLCTFLSVIIATELGKIISKETKIDILATPSVTIISGIIFAKYSGEYIQGLMSALGDIINKATTLEPFYMGILVSVIMGIILTLPISSAALAIILGLSGLAAGAATAGCAAQMIGFAVASFKDNGIGGLVSQGLGTSMLQIPNIFKKPTIWIAPTLASAITGPIATMIFKMENIPVAAGMGTSGLVGPIGVITAMGSNANTYFAVAIVCFIAPAILTLIFDKILRKLKLVKNGDMQLPL